MVWCDFFTRRVKDESLDSPDALLRLLHRMAVNKVKETHRRHLDCQKRSLHRQAPLPADVVDPRPSVEQIVAAEDELSSILQGVQGNYRKAVLLVQLGYPPTSAARLAEVPARVFERMVENARHQLRKRRGETVA
jgi:DNA-directed RNA polymerase specialized sigma24 family protein